MNIGIRLQILFETFLVMACLIVLVHIYKKLNKIEYHAAYNKCMLVEKLVNGEQYFKMYDFSNHALEETNE